MAEIFALSPTVAWDPADRILVATARLLGAKLATESLAACCRNGKFARIEGAGHAALLEDFDSVALLIDNFLDTP